MDPLLLVVTVNLYCYVLFNITDTTQFLGEQDVFSYKAVFSVVKCAFLTSRLSSTSSSFCELLTHLLLFKYCSGDTWRLLALSWHFSWSTSQTQYKKLKVWMWINTKYFRSGQRRTQASCCTSNWSDIKCFCVSCCANTHCHCPQLKHIGDTVFTLLVKLVTFNHLQQFKSLDITWNCVL